MNMIKQKIYELTDDGSGSLASVLRAIPEGRWKIYMSYDKKEHLCFSDFNTIARWNLLTDYDGQTQEVKEFVGKLIGV